MYGECVEYYDSQNDPIKFYFLEKIQTLLSGDRVFSKLKEKPSPTIKLVHRRNKSELSQFRRFDKPEDYESDQSPTKRFQIIQEEDSVSPNVPSATKIRRSRQRKMSLMIELNRIQQEVSENQELLLSNFNQAAEKAENLIKFSLNEQENFILERQKKRKSALASKRLSHESTSLAQFQEKQVIHFDELFKSLG